MKQNVSAVTTTEHFPERNYGPCLMQALAPRPDWRGFRPNALEQPGAVFNVSSYPSRVQ